MTTAVLAGPPRYVRVAGRWINAYKVFLCLGLYVGILASAAAAAAAGWSPLAEGLACLAYALLGLVGARAYHVAVNWAAYRRGGLGGIARDTERGGWSLFGALVIVPLTFARETVLGIPVASFWDHTAVGIALGGACIRFGCIRNGCCVGRPSAGWLALRQHDVYGVSLPRIPVQWMEIGWWLIAALGWLALRPAPLPAGSYALGVFAWYGIGRFWLEPLRESSDLVRDRIRIDRMVAAALAIVAVTALLRVARG
ncbi:MAG TPA: prolipoprotein diacylglyceryl transferase family protein [Candidatus Binatia bacterium]|nr:prolipoprotein diacylglyceryl transferase family protein [Candidatus Binatia bacterium]